MEKLTGHEDYEELSNEPAFSKMAKEWKAYASAGLSPEVCAEYRKFEDEVVASGMTFGEVVELMYAERDGQLYTLHDVAVILASAIGDDCACNINSNDEWLPQLCELQEACPDPVGVACWEQYLKHRAQPANEPLTKISEMLEQAAQDMDDKCRQWQCVLQRAHDAGEFDQNSGLWVGIDKEREAKAQASFEAYRYSLGVIDKIAEQVCPQAGR